MNPATADLGGFRLLFRYAGREPEFRDLVDTLMADSTEIAHRHIIAWLDAGRPDPDRAAKRISQAVHGVIQAAQSR